MSGARNPASTAINPWAEGLPFLLPCRDTFRRVESVEGSSVEPLKQFQPKLISLISDLRNVLL